jgi:deoxyribose-phosphate aldolase
MSDITLSAKGSPLAKYIDHTLLKPEAASAAYKQLFAEALEYQFFSVCIPPSMVSLAKRALAGSSVKICTVVGFPHGLNLVATKVFETKLAIDQGADEIDMVINISALKSGDKTLVADDIASVVRAANGKTVKVILETGLLTLEEKIIGCQLSESSGAHFVKTSTGFAGSGATLEDVQLMRKTVGPRVQVKASGGIKDATTALKMIEAGATRLGTSSGIAIITGAAASTENKY